MSPFNKFFARLVLSVTAISLIFISSNADKDLIISACSKAIDPVYCRSIFLGDPHAEAADVRGLALFVISATRYKAEDTLNYKIADLYYDATDPVAKHRLEQCKDDYQDAVLKFMSAHHSTENGKFADAINFVRKACSDIAHCSDIYSYGPIARSPVYGENYQIGIQLPAVILTVLDDLV